MSGCYKWERGMCAKNTQTSGKITVYFLLSIEATDKMAKNDARMREVLREREVMIQRFTQLKKNREMAITTLEARVRVVTFLLLLCSSTFVISIGRGDVPLVPTAQLEPCYAPVKRTLRFFPQNKDVAVLRKEIETLKEAVSSHDNKTKWTANKLKAEESAHKVRVLYRCANRNFFSCSIRAAK